MDTTFLLTLIGHQPRGIPSTESNTFIFWGCSIILYKADRYFLYAATKSPNLTSHDYDSLLDIAKYLWQTNDIGQAIHPGKKREPLRLKCFVDIGYCITVGDIGTFYSKSVKQQLVVTTSTHAEVKALYQAIVDLIYIINLCVEIGRAVDLPVIIFEDNNPTVQLSRSLSARVKRSKYFLLLVHNRQNVVPGLIEMHKVASEYNLADVSTCQRSPWRGETSTRRSVDFLASPRIKSLETAP